MNRRGFLSTTTITTGMMVFAPHIAFADRVLFRATEGNGRRVVRCHGGELRRVADHDMRVADYVIFKFDTSIAGEHDLFVCEMAQAGHDQPVVLSPLGRQADLAATYARSLRHYAEALRTRIA